VITANPLRGELNLALNGRSIILRPTFERLVAAESEIGSLVKLTQRVYENNILLNEIVSLLWHCADDNIGDRVQFEKNIIECGIKNFIPTFLSILFSIFGNQ
jgi:hypothetical protein